MENKIKVAFCYLNREIEVFCEGDTKMDEIYGKFVSKLSDGSEVNHYIYFYEDNKLGHESTIEKDKYLSGKTNIKIRVQKKLRIIKCPECKCNDCIINLNNYFASYYGCKNNHSSSSVYDKYIFCQKIDSSEIRCFEPGCQRNQQNYGLGFYKCLTCSSIVKSSEYFCKEHILFHKNHIIVKYDKKNYYCEKHFNKFIKYCFTHHQNLCEECEKEHQGDNIADYGLMTPNVDNLKESLKIMKENIDLLKSIIFDIKDRLDGSLRIYKRYLYIAKDIIGKFELFNKDLKNNRILKSLWNLLYSNNKMNDKLTSIINEENLMKKTDLLLYIYEKKEEYYRQNINKNIDFKKEDDEWWKEIKKNEIYNNKKVEVDKKKDLK